MKDRVFYSKKTLNAKGKILDFSTPAVMGILNVTPDSFYDGGAYTEEKKIIERAREIIVQGGAIIDIGAYSTRPGATDITEAEEVSRLIPAINYVIREFPGAIISVDTFRSEVARRAVEAGAVIVNDISGGNLDPQMFRAVKELQVPYMMMHMKGAPQNMVHLASYDDIVQEIVEYFRAKIAILNEAGIYDLVIDPGFGFAKTREHSFELLKNLNYLKIVKMPILVGVSRKSMIYKTLNVDPKDSLNGTTALNTIALMNGADILRVHDVKECVETVKLYKSVYP